MGIEVGFYGKLPSHGDFLRRRVDEGFVAVWDEWLQECLQATRAALGPRWLDIYLTSPVWRFACAPGVFGRRPVVGLMAPSVDRVGRYFHLTIVAALPDHVNIVNAVTAGGSFFDSAERLALDALAAERGDFETFDRQVAALGMELDALTAPVRFALDRSASAVLGESLSRWRIPIATPVELGPVFQALVAERLLAVHDPAVIWWTDGSEYVEPSCLISRGLPEPETFAALLDGAWDAHAWEGVPAVIEAEEGTAELPLLEATPPRFRSAAASDVGRARKINQDAFLERPDVGLWVVADGLGGHSHGEVASRMVCDALADFVPAASFEQVVEGAIDRLRQVNEQLVNGAAGAADGGSGSTVVALLTRASRYAVLWAGDSRAYRWRGERLEQLTQDHSAGEEGPLGGVSTAITRAVGGEPILLVDTARGRVEVGDRFLLCSDGLTRTLPEETIVEHLKQPDPRVCADALIAATLEAGAPDNVTVTVIDAWV